VGFMEKTSKKWPMVWGKFFDHFFGFFKNGDYGSNKFF